MREIYYVYNNEAISSCIILSILNQIEKLDIARSCLVLPFLLDDRTVSHLAKNDSELNLEDLVREQSRLFVSFNKRYLSLLPVTINSLILLNKSNQIKIENEITNVEIINIEEGLGERFAKVKAIIPKFLSMIENYSTPQLYKILKVQL
ncbi:MAG: three component ABC system middle component [Aequorivita antarctica]